VAFIADEEKGCTDGALLVGLFDERDIVTVQGGKEEKSHPRLRKPAIEPLAPSNRHKEGM